MDLETKLNIENLKVASFFKRVLSYWIDEFIVSMIIFIAFFDQFSAQNGNMMNTIKVINSMIIYFIFLKTAYHTIFIHLYGKTIGKIVLKIRAVDIQTFDNPSWQRAFLRALLRNFDEMFFYLGMLFALTNPFVQALHDKLSKVVVIND